MRLPYVTERRGRLFWQPKPAMRAKGFLPMALGDAGDLAAIGKARELYRAWLKVKDGEAPITAWPRGSLGHWYDAMRRTPAWAKLKPRSREDYERGWRYIAPAFGAKGLKAVTVEDCEALADRLELERGPHERYRTIKVLRSMYSDAISRLRLHGFVSPAKGLSNPQPRGRGAVWFGAEVPRLIKAAEDNGYAGMAIAIRVAWDTLYSPVDVRTAVRAQLQRDGKGAWLERTRTKTGKEAFGHLSPATMAAIDAAIAAFEAPGVKLADGSPFIRQRNGHAYRSKDTFGDDFRAVRAIAFPGDTRQFQDLRRSGNLEADLAGADKATMAELLANTLDRSTFLDDTYTPPTVAKARDVAKQRLKGRAKLAAEATRLRTRSV